MTDETTLAFAALEARAAATTQGAPLDRISVRDYMIDADIGAFQIERGVSQRLRFNVVLEVARHAAAATDDVDQVLSYEAIVDAIDQQMAVERLNLLETLAERIAGQVLGHPQSVRVFVRIEKLDRIPGVLGVEIVRSRIAGMNVTPLKERQIIAETNPESQVVFMPNLVLQGAEIGDWLQAIATHALPAIICVSPTGLQIPVTGISGIDLRLELLSIEQNALFLAAKDSRCIVVNSRTELDWALKNDQLAVWAPAKIVLDAVDKPDLNGADPLALAYWFAQVMEAGPVAVLGADAPPESAANFRHVPHPGAL